MLQKISTVIESSVRFAMENQTEAIGQMKKYAQELDDRVIWSHVDLYVNGCAVDLRKPLAKNSVGKLIESPVKQGFQGQQAWEPWQKSPPKV